jgi:hypothetical protein
MSELSGRHLMAPSSERPASGQGEPNRKNQVRQNSGKYADARLERQASKLSRVFLFCPATARLIASLAYEVRR